MAAKPKMQQNLSLLRKDTEKVMHDLDTLTQQLKQAGRDTAENAVGDLGNRMEDQIRQLNEKMQEIKTQIRDGAQTVDKNVHEQPYIYMACAAGLGFVMGKLTGRKSSASS